MNKYQEALQDCVDLFEAWKEGIFSRIGVSWTIEPPAIVKAKALLNEKGMKL